MKKRIVVLSLGVMMCCGFTGCKSPIDSPDKKICDFTIIESNLYDSIIADKTTGVLYYQRGSNRGLMPIYNADGTLKTYDEVYGENKND